MYFIRSTLFSQNVAPPEDIAKAKNIDLAIQFTLLWIPALVLVAWIVKMPLTLLFGMYYGRHLYAIQSNICIFNNRSL